MRVLTQIRRSLDAWYLGAEDAIRSEHARRHQERIDREHLYLAARLEAVQAEVSFRARVRVSTTKRSSEVIPFPWRLS